MGVPCCAIQGSAKQSLTKQRYTLQLGDIKGIEPSPPAEPIRARGRAFL